MILIYKGEIKYDFGIKWHFLSLFCKIKYQLQDLVVTLDVIDQIECFQYQIKGENVMIQMVQLMFKMIKMMQFYIQIEWTYAIFK